MAANSLQLNEWKEKTAEEVWEEKNAWTLDYKILRLTPKSVAFFKVPHFKKSPQTLLGEKTLD